MKSCVVYAAPEDVAEIRQLLGERGFEVRFLDRDPSAPLLSATGEPPLQGTIAADAIAPAVRDYLTVNRIQTAKDLGNLELNALAAAPGVTRESLTKFVRALARSERYPHADALQEFLVRRGIFI